MKTASEVARANEEIAQIGREIEQLEKENRFIDSYVERWKPKN